MKTVSYFLISSKSQEVGSLLRMCIDWSLHRQEAASSRAVTIALNDLCAAGLVMEFWDLKQRLSIRCWRVHFLSLTA